MRRQISPNELDTLYQGVGKCVWHIQYLEDALHTYLTMKVEIRQPGRVSEDEALALLSKHRRANLGTALGTATKHGAVSPELLAELRELKEERDWLVHRSMHEDGDSLYTDQGRKAVLSRLDALMHKTLELKGRLLREIVEFCAGHGVSSEQAAELARQQIARRKGEAFQETPSK